jgi:DEAD/DEAH box helicase domain-containing protein
VNPPSAIEDFLEDLQSARGYEGQLAHLRRLPGRKAVYGELPAGLAPAAVEMLASQGLRRLYRHQTEALEAVFAGQNLALAAGTAAGKTLGYLLPIVQGLATDRGERSLLLYPTKALAQDQLRKLHDFGAGETFLADTYDGDTPPSLRRQIRRQTQVILSNPDMLHVGLLPHHPAWAEFFRRLRYVVLDEVHVYRGVFGSHVANTLRRLRRVCDYYGSRPQFICASATIGNPGELCELLTGLPFTVVDRDTAPQGPRLVGFWNPALTKQSSGKRESTNWEAARLLAGLMRRGVRTIAFTQSRMQAELILRYAQDLLKSERALQERLAPYRGGYLPEERREIERRLFSGELLAVVATSALELGVDIGGLDAVIMAGYPGDTAAFRQQAGRAGRAHQESLALLVAAAGGIDQYLMENPDFLMTAAHDRALCRPDNRFILGAHLLCAAYELPLQESDTRYFGPEMEAILGVLTEHGLLDKRRRWYWADPERYPPGEVSLRSGSGQAYEIHLADGRGARTTGTLLGTVDDASVFWLAHPGAVYLHAGESYVVQDLDLPRRRITVQRRNVDYYTRAMNSSEMRVAQEYAHAPLPAEALAHLGELVVHSQTLGYRRLQISTDKELEMCPLDLPATDFETVGLWVTLEDDGEALVARGHDLMGSLHALEHAMIGLLPLFAMCDPHDLGGVSYSTHPDTGRPTLCVYDGYPGGVGLCEQAYDGLAALLQATAERIEKCPCADGCPACVQSPSCGNNNEPLDKAGAAVLARMWLGKPAKR